MHPHLDVGGQTVCDDPWVADFHKDFDDMKLELLPIIPYSVDHHQPVVCSSGLEISPPKFLDLFCDRDIMTSFSGSMMAVGNKYGNPVLNHL